MPLQPFFRRVRSKTCSLSVSEPRVQVFNNGLLMISLCPVPIAACCQLYSRQATAVVTLCPMHAGAVVSLILKHMHAINLSCKAKSRLSRPFFEGAGLL